jgi:hypothetical protein
MIDISSALLQETEAAPALGVLSTSVIYSLVHEGLFRNVEGGDIPRLLNGCLCSLVWFVALSH